MADQCRHKMRSQVIDLCRKSGWAFESETAKAIRFHQGNFALNFNGEDSGFLDLIFDPILAGANILTFMDSGAKIHERFSSNFDNFPSKMSKKECMQHFGVGLKFESISQAEEMLDRIQFPEMSI
jgi:hypothetical protein